jgi:predicted Zn-dependent protease
MRRRPFVALIVLATAALRASSLHPCEQCHPKEVAGYAVTAWHIRWHERPGAFAKRDLGLAYAEAGRTFQSAKYMLQRYQSLAAYQPDFPNDPAVVTGIGLVLLGTDRSAEAAEMFERAVRLEPRITLMRALRGNRRMIARKLSKTCTKHCKLIQC